VRLVGPTGSQQIDLVELWHIADVMSYLLESKQHVYGNVGRSEEWVIGVTYTMVGVRQRRD